MFKVYNALGPGLLESIYESALYYQLKKDGLNVYKQVEIPVKYDDILLDITFKLDLVVEDKVIVELKSVEELKSIHFKQLTTYLKLTNKKLGLLVNFNSLNTLENIHRIVNKI
ncbi:GxxExxY protein [Flavobacterium sp. Fl-77]|uniref:GxxExxY protein n=1 Tax=Flavobacterium flavipigmentatum TaxID=2893884 RepID=A0AAJ2VXP7_9FLAO|nr:MULTISPECIES: GxxExxY protein [unclassified Flavobacterium]MDX6183491.1 GxxExxY protein [Flavobacterium sp. Fl-33]MDX6187107.1 GxxExxY protein [Flavobacterium sp. Fl-77]UFH40550.1 GxxExxY protein [Flavobacterium sp. F-70]